MELGKIKVNDLCTALRDRATLLTTLGEKEDNPTARVRTLRSPKRYDLGQYH